MPADATVPLTLYLGDNVAEAQRQAAISTAAAVRSEAAADSAENFATIAQGEMNYYATVSAGASATTAPDTFSSDEDGLLRWYDADGNVIGTPADISLLATYVDNYGAAGDGTTLDDDAVDAAITAAGIGGTIRFTPPKVYLLGRQHTLLSGQKVDYNGATVKRAPQGKTTLTVAFSDDAPIGDTVVLTVADTSDFEVGQRVSVVLTSRRQRTAAEAALLGAGQVTANEGGENPYAADTQSHAIASKTSSTLSVSGGFFSATFTDSTEVTEYPIGAEVVHAFAIWAIPADAPNVEIFGGEHDGGTSAHDAGASGSTADGYQVRGRRWETTQEIHGAGDNARIHDMRFVDVPAEAIILAGRGSIAERCTFTNIGGNATHHSGGNDIRVDKCFTFGANRVWIDHDGLTAADIPKYGTLGHENGCYAWSQECERVHLTNCYGEDALCLFSPLYSPLNDEGTIHLCTGRNLVVGFHLMTATGQGADVILDTVRLYDCGDCIVGRTDTSVDFTETQVRTTLLDCELVNTRLLLKYAQQFSIKGGHVRHDTPATTGAVITVNGGADIEIATHIDGCQFGVYASGVVDGLKISCTWSRVHSYAIGLLDLDTASRRVHVTDNDALIADYRVTDDADATTAPASDVTFCQMDLGLASDNRIRMTKGRAAFDVYTGTAQVKRNWLETNTSTTTRGVLIATGTGSVVEDNDITVAIRDDPGRGVSAGSAVSASGGTPGNGAVGSLTADALALTGVYRVVFIAAASDAGTFIVYRPDGVVDGLGKVATAYDGMINFTIADGSTDFSVGDHIPITVTGNVIERNRIFTWAA